MSEQLLLQRQYSLTAMTLTNVVFPEYCKPTRVNSISSFQKRLLNQSKIRLIKANIFAVSFDEPCEDSPVFIHEKWHYWQHALRHSPIVKFSVAI